MRPESTTSCGAKQPCLTLSTVAGNTTAYFTSSSVFHFLPGSHTVNETTPVTVEGIDSVSLVGSSLGAGYATVECNGRLSFSFKNIGHVNISKMEFFSCGLAPVSSVWGRQINTLVGLTSSPHVALFFSYCSSVTLENVKVMNSYGYGLLEWNIGRTNLINCQFYCSNQISYKEKDHERVSTLHHSCSKSSQHDEPGGNVLFAVSNFFMPDAFVKISHSEFAYGIAKGSHAYTVIGGGGLAVYVGALQRLNGVFFGESSVYIQIDNCSLHDNVSPIGANMLLRSTEYHNLILYVRNSKFYNGNSTYSGGGLAFYLRPKYWDYSIRVTSTGYVNKFTIHFIAHITNSSFNNNYARNGSGIYISTTHSSSISLIIEQCILYNNVGEFGSAMYLLDRSGSDDYLFIAKDIIHITV